MVSSPQRDGRRGGHVAALRVAHLQAPAVGGGRRVAGPVVVEAGEARRRVQREHAAAVGGQPLHAAGPPAVDQRDLQAIVDHLPVDGVAALQAQQRHAHDAVGGRRDGGRRHGLPPLPAAGPAPNSRACTSGPSASDASDSMLTMRTP